MKKYFFILSLLILVNSCIDKEVGLGVEEFVISGKVYSDCSKNKLYKNTPLEIQSGGHGWGGQKVEVLATGKTSEDGSFSITYKTSRAAQGLSLTIPANDDVQMFIPIGVHAIRPIENMIDKDFYISPKTDVKVRIKCGRIYTNQDTLYINQPFAYDSQNQPIIHKIVAPQTNMILDWKDGKPKFNSNCGAAYGISWAEYKKASSGVNGKPEYNFFRFNYPTCENSPMEIVLNLP